MRENGHKTNIYLKLKFLIILVMILLTVVFLESILLPTTSRYIKRAKDEIIAHYTSLYLNSNGDNRVVALENDIGYVDFKLMNYIDEDVTQRDIEYSISTPNVFYDASGRELSSSRYGLDDLYVLDVWKTPQLIGKDTYKYDVSIIANDGEKLDGDDYKFTYEKINNTPIGKNHNITLKIVRKQGDTLSGIEHISVVVQLSKPYKEVYVIDIIISNRIIAFSTANKENFEIGFNRLYVQSVNSFGYVQDGTSYIERTGIVDSSVKYQNEAIKLTLKWNKAFLDEVELGKLHLGYREDETASNVDITKPYIVSLESTYDTGTIVIYVPQSSNFYLDFLPNGEDFTLDAQIEISTNIGYQIYSETEYGGYNHINGYYTIYKGL